MALSLITDRAASDVSGKTDKGYYNCIDLNRVGGAVAYLGALLNGYGYSVAVSPRTDWTRTDIPRVSDMAGYLADVAAIKARFYGATELPSSMACLSFDGANGIEALLLEVEGYITSMAAGFRHCGMFKTGQGVILP